MREERAGGKGADGRAFGSCGVGKEIWGVGGDGERCKGGDCGGRWRAIVGRWEGMEGMEKMMGLGRTLGRRMRGGGDGVSDREERTYRVPIRMSDWIRTTPFWWTRVCAWPIRCMTASQEPSVGEVSHGFWGCYVLGKMAVFEIGAGRFYS